jgi:hypothetical protein
MAAPKCGKAAPADTGNRLSKIEQLGGRLDLASNKKAQPAQTRPSDLRRPKGEADSSSSVDDGRRQCGTIEWACGVCHAFDADENLIGVFATTRAAMKAITAAARQ